MKRFRTWLPLANRLFMLLALGTALWMWYAGAYGHAVFLLFVLCWLKLCQIAEQATGTTIIYLDDPKKLSAGPGSARGEEG